MKAPFNFVPLPNKIYKPFWGNQISQDIPFSDTQSGILDVEIYAENPIFVRNGHTKKEGETKEGDYKSFSKTPDGKFYIPGTSLKGEVRNILEILSFGKLRVDPNAMFALRELQGNKRYKEFMGSQLNAFDCGGWLKFDKENGCYKIDVCKHTYRINLVRLDEYFGFNEKDKGFCYHFMDGFSKFDLNKPSTEFGNETDPKSSVFKYKIVERYGKGLSLTTTFRKDIQYNNKDVHNRVMHDPNGDIKGTIVFSGQPGKRKSKKTGKFYDFVFSNEIDRTITVTKEVFDNYKFIYANTDYWSELKKGLYSEQGVPVFCRNNSDGSLKDFGFALLYKLPYKNKPIDLEKRRQGNSDFYDMAECIFGTVNEDDALKGRVQFTAFVSDDAKTGKETPLVLNEPKASYYPMYIEQDGTDGVAPDYKTYDDDDARLSGWKRYVLRDDAIEDRSEMINNQKLRTLIYPLQKGCTFKGKIAYHNLKQVELGALLSALTFHGNNNCYHQLGQGKSFGYGKVKITVKSSTIDINRYLSLFEKEMEHFTNGEWISSQTLKELYTLSSTSVSTSDNNFSYMKMNVKDRDDNEFINEKKEKKYLERFSKIIQKNGQFNSQKTNEYEEDYNALRQQEKILNEAKERLVKTYNNLLNEAREFARSYNFTDAEKKVSEAKELLPLNKEYIKTEDYINQKRLEKEEKDRKRIVSSYVDKAKECIEKMDLDIAENYCDLAKHIDSCNRNVDELLVQIKQLKEENRLNGLKRQDIEFINNLAKTDLQAAIAKGEECLKNSPLDEDFKALLENLKRQNTVSNGIATILDEKYTMGDNIGKYKVSSFKVATQKIDKYFKAVNQNLSEEDINAIHSTIVRLNDGSKEWGNFEKGNIWLSIKKWVGEETAKVWFSNINK